MIRTRSISTVFVSTLLVTTLYSTCGFAAPKMDKEQPRVVRDENVKPRLDSPLQCKGGTIVDGKCDCPEGSTLIKLGENKFQCKK